MSRCLGAGGANCVEELSSGFFYGAACSPRVFELFCYEVQWLCVGSRC